MCRAVGGDPAKTPPLSSSSKLKTACNLIPSSPPSTKQSTGPLRTCCLCHGFLGRLRLSIQRPRVQSSPPTPRVNVSYLSLVWNQRSVPMVLPALPPAFTSTCLTSSPVSPGAAAFMLHVAWVFPGHPDRLKPPPSPHSKPIPESPPRPLSFWLPLISQCRPKGCPCTRPSFLWTHRQCARVHFCSSKSKVPLLVLMKFHP